MEILEIGQTPFVINGHVSNKINGTGATVNAALFAQLPPKHHVFTIPLELQEIPSPIEALKTRLGKCRTEKIMISLHGVHLQHPLIAELGEALPGKEFGILGQVINFFKA